MTDNRQIIQWFPGHMAKSLKQMEAQAKLCDFFVYVLDARAPQSCLNPEFVKIVNNKPIIFVLNKADLADDKATASWKAYLTRNANAQALSLNSTQSKSGQIVIRTIKQIFADRIEANNQKGARFILRGMVLGVPNCGKSSLINNLVGKARTTTGDKPGVTRSTQWVKLSSSIEIMDTPGTLCPSFADQTIGYKLAVIGSIKDDVVNLYDLCCYLISIDKQAILKHYNAEEGESMRETIEAIARKRGCVLKGNEIDFERVEKLILTDFRAGKFGKITLDSMES